MIDTADQKALADWLSEKTELTPTKNLRCVGRRGSEGGIIGVVGYDGFTDASTQIHFAGEGNWLSRGLLWAMFDYPFRVANVELVFGCIKSSNHRSLRLARRLGFKQEHVLRGMFRDCDGVLMSMTRDECRYLRGAQNG